MRLRHFSSRGQHKVETCTTSVVDRFSQVEPTVLITVGGYTYGNKEIDKSAEVTAIRKGLPTLRHVVGNLQVLGEEGGAIRARANYVVMQVLYDRPEAKLHQVGVYHDVFRRENGVLKLAERRCVYDNLLVPNALCLPV